MNIEQIKGVGPQLKSKLHKLGIFTHADLLEYYPYKYNYIKIQDIDNISNDELCMIKSVIVEEAKVIYIKKSFNRLTFKSISNNCLMNVTIFNRAFLKNNIKVGKEVVLIGKYNKLKSSFIANDIKFSVNDNTIEPIYHMSEGLKNSQLMKIILEALKDMDVSDRIPKKYIQKYNLISKKEAINLIHRPNSLDDIKKASARLKYEELFDFMFKINYLKSLNMKVLGIKRNVDFSYKETFLKLLPFKLTVDQEKAIEEIHKDLNQESRMNRLVLGDVGSGKTVVAMYAIYVNFLSGYQSALMAPTEILAEQHYKNLKSILEKYNIKISLLTGSMKLKDKKVILKDIENGDTNLVIGTHALISDSVKFKNLGLVITDEQHRFGVNQRNILRDKGNVPDVLYLSATPIPRTYALTIYGDLDISVIKTKPHGRKEIITKVVLEDNIKEVLYKMLEEIKNNHQIYVVSPLIENEEESNLKSVTELKEKINIAFQGKVEIEILHGKIKNTEKDLIMNRFKNGDIKILISTTVIEVGIDVPNATMMIIYNAERFGLATLHQLRGRVGRNDLQSYCYLICNKELERLTVLEETNDGFEISEKDFQMRGQGDLFGEKQSGSIPFKIANLKEDYRILLSAKKDSEKFIDDQEYLDSDYYTQISREISFIN